MIIDMKGAGEPLFNTNYESLEDRGAISEMISGTKVRERGVFVNKFP